MNRIIKLLIIPVFLVWARYKAIRAKITGETNNWM